MAAASDSTAGLLAALERLVGKPERAKHGDRFRFTAVSVEGKRVAIRLGPISMNRERPSAKCLNEIADKLHLDRATVGEQLNQHTGESLLAHLRKQPADQLKPPQHRPPKKTAK